MKKIWLCKTSSASNVLCFLRIIKYIFILVKKITKSWCVVISLLHTDLESVESGILLQFSFLFSLLTASVGIEPFPQVGSDKVRHEPVSGLQAATVGKPWTSLASCFINKASHAFCLSGVTVTCPDPSTLMFKNVVCNHCSQGDQS